MVHTHTPIAFLRRQTEILRTHVPGLLDGCLDSIHDARIATRRIREALPLTHEWQRRRVADDLFACFRRMGRSLGGVRDVDVRIELLRYLESRIPPAAPSLVVVRQGQEAERLRLVRKLVKRFERLHVEGELDRLSGSGPRARFWPARSSAWRSQLRHLVAERAHGARDAISHATGVYFPNRAHQARIAIKKFRYAAEICQQTGLIADEPLMRDLKKAQDVLGLLHDRQALIDGLPDSAAKDDEIDAAQIRLVVQVLDAEIVDLHRQFLGRRSQLLQSCVRAERDIHRSDLATGALAVAGVMALTGLEIMRRRQRTRRGVPEAEASRKISVRIPVALPTVGAK